MAKKKKTPLKKSENLTVKTTPASAQKPIDDVPPTDLLSLRLAQSATSSSSKRVDVIPHAFLSEQDAAALDVLQDEEVILLATSSNQLEDTAMISGAAICRVDVGASARTPSRSEGKRLSVAPGSIRISPSSVIDALFQSDTPLSTGNQSSPATQITPSLERRQHVEETPPPPASPSSTPGKFSFAKGGGGEQLHSTPTPSTPSTPNFRTPSKLPPHSLWVVPLESSFGHRNSMLSACGPCRSRGVQRSTCDRMAPPYSYRWDQMSGLLVQPP
jgi:hypothetical protein